MTTAPMINFVGVYFFQLKTLCIFKPMNKIKIAFRYAVKGIFLVLAFITLLLLIPSYLAAFYVSGYNWAKRGIDQYLLAINSSEEIDKEIVDKFYND